MSWCCRIASNHFAWRFSSNGGLKIDNIQQIDRIQLKFCHLLEKRHIRICGAFVILTRLNSTITFLHLFCFWHSSYRLLETIIWPATTKKYLCRNCGRLCLQTICEIYNVSINSILLNFDSAWHLTTESAVSSNLKIQITILK